MDEILPNTRPTFDDRFCLFCCGKLESKSIQSIDHLGKALFSRFAVSKCQWFLFNPVINCLVMMFEQDILMTYHWMLIVKGKSTRARKEKVQ